ncbi:MAG: hypothetical protein V3V70_07100 [Candidatus Scalindua sp.]
MLTLCIIGSIVWVLVLLFCFAIFSLASRADEIEYTSGTKMAEESAREVGERNASVKAA